MADKSNDYELLGEVQIDTSGIEKATLEVKKSFDAIDKSVAKTTKSIDKLSKKTKESLKKITPARQAKIDTRQAQMQAKYDAFIQKTKDNVFSKSKTLIEARGSTNNELLNLERNFKNASGKLKPTIDDQATIQGFKATKSKLLAVQKDYDLKIMRAGRLAIEKEEETLAKNQIKAQKKLEQQKKMQPSLDRQAQLDKEETALVRFNKKQKLEQSKADRDKKKADTLNSRTQKANADASANYNQKSNKKITDDIMYENKNRTLTGKETVNKLQTQLKGLQGAYDLASKKRTALTKDEKSTINSYNYTKKALDGVKTSLNSVNHEQFDFFKNAVKWSVTYKVINAVFTSFKAGIVSLKEIDDALVNIRKVTDMSAEQAQKLALNASKEVAQYGRTVQDYLASYEQFAKAGFRDQVLTNLSELSLLLQNVGDITAEVANKTLIASNAGFKLGGDYQKLSHIIDAMNNISNNNAVTIEKMSEAITVSASVAETAGFSFDQYMSIIGTASAVTQREGSVIGRAVRTIVANILKVNDAEADVDAESFAKAGASLNEIAKIDLTDTAGNMRSVFDILSELNGKWAGLTDLQRQELAGNVANKQQIDVFIGLMNNWTMVEKQLGEAVGSTGSALQENETYLDSITAKTNEFRNAVTGLWLNTIESGTIKSIIELGTNLVNLTDFLGMGRVAVIAFATTFTGIVIPAFIKLKKAYIGAKIAGEGLLGTLAITPWGMVAIAVGVLVTGLMVLNANLEKSSQKFERLSEESLKLSDTFQDEISEINNLNTKYESLINKKIRTTEETLELSRTISKLNEYYRDNNISVNDTEIATGILSDTQVEFADKTQEAILKLNGEKDALNSVKVATEKLTKAKLDKLVVDTSIKKNEAEALLNQKADTAFGYFDYDYMKLADVVDLNGTETFIELYDKLQQILLNNPDGLTGQAYKDIENYYIKMSKGYDEAQNAIDAYNSALAQQKALLNSIADISTAPIATLTSAINSITEVAKTSMDSLSEGITELNDAIITLSEGNKLSSKDLTALVEKYPELLNYVNLETGQLDLQVDTLKELRASKLADTKITIESQKEKLKSLLATNKIAIGLYKNEIDALKILSQAQIDVAKASLLNSIAKYGISPQQVTPEVRAKLKALQDEFDAYNKASEAIRALTLYYYENANAGKEASEAFAKEKYEKAVSDIESLQGRIVDALKAKYEEQNKLAVDAIEAQRKAENDAFDLRIKELEAEKKAIEATREEEDKNLEALKEKLKLAKLDNSVFGKKRQTELEKEIKDLEKKLKLEDLDIKIQNEQTANEEKNTYYDTQIENIDKMYEEMEKEAKLFAEANKLILSNSVQEIAKLLETYAPTFGGIGQILGKSMASEMLAEVNNALSQMGVVNGGVSTSSPSTPQGSTTAPNTASGVSLAWTGKNYSKGSSDSAVNKRIQDNLIAKGYGVGSSGADGKFGSNTQDAIKKFQKAMGLTADGVVGKKTWEKLIAFKSGGIPQFNASASGGVVYAHAKERILSATQTNTFDDFVYKFLPSFTKFMHTFDKNGTSTNNSNVNVDVEMNNYINSEFDENNMMDNFNRIIKKNLFAKGVRV